MRPVVANSSMEMRVIRYGSDLLVGPNRKSQLPCPLSKLLPSGCLSPDISVEGELQNRSVIMKVGSLKPVKDTLLAGLLRRNQLRPLSQSVCRPRVEANLKAQCSVVDAKSLSSDEAQHLTFESKYCPYILPK